MITVITGTFWGYVTVCVLIVVGIIGFIIGTGNSSFFIAPRDKWAKSQADITGEQMKIGCVYAVIFMVIVGWLIVKIFG